VSQRIRFLMFPGCIPERGFSPLGSVVMQQAEISDEVARLSCIASVGINEVRRESPLIRKSKLLISSGSTHPAAPPSATQFLCHIYCRWPLRILLKTSASGPSSLTKRSICVAASSSLIRR
jgi:hypothetical protein